MAAQVAIVALTPSAMVSMLRLSGSFALRGLKSATTGGQASSSSTSTKKVGAMPLLLSGKGSIGAALFFGSGKAGEGAALCYSGTMFVPSTESSPPSVSTKVRNREGNRE